MTEEIGWASLGIVPNLTGFDSKLSRSLDPALSGVGQRSGKLFGGILGKAAVAGAAGIIGAGFAAFNLAKSSIAEARDAQEVSATTVAILKSTQHAAHLTKGAYDDLTTSLMKKTAIDDDQIARGGNLLLTFKNVKREGKGLKDIFGRALAGSLDLTAAGFGSIESTSKQLGKALNDPVKGMSALSRAGVTFTADQQETIKSLVETGDLLGAQKIILKEVESQVGGTAEAQKTSAKELSVAWGNVKEEIGDALIPVMDDLADVMLDKGIPAGEKFSDWLKKDGIPQVKDFGKKAEALAKDVFPTVKAVLGDVRDILAKAAPKAKALVDAFQDMPEWAQKALVGGSLAAFAGSKLGLGSLLGSPKGKSGSGLLGLVSKARPLPVFVVNGGVGGTGIPGVPGVPTPGEKAPKKIPKSLLTAGYAAPFVAVGIGAEAMAAYLGSRPAGDDPARSKAYQDRLNTPGYGQQGIQFNSIDPLTGLPSITFKNDTGQPTNPLLDPIGAANRELDEMAKRKIKIDVDTTDADLKIRRLRDSAAQPIHAQLIIDQAGNVHSTLGGHSAPVPGEEVPQAAGQRYGGITVHGGMHVAPDDYKGFQRDMQRRGQQAALGGIGALAS